METRIEGIARVERELGKRESDRAIAEHRDRAERLHAPRVAIIGMPNVHVE